MWKMKKFWLTFVVVWAGILGFSLYENFFESTLQYAVTPCILALIITAMAFSLGSQLKKGKISSSHSIKKTTVNTIYVCENLSAKIVYEIRNGKVYPPLSKKAVYEIKNGKVYRVLESKAVFVIAGNKVYEPLKKEPRYRIENNKVYEGNFGKVPLFVLRQEKNIV